ncbi:MAG: ABC transporter substrate-binding protein [Calditrichaeota bacterium]|nr:ABC transporter substrate-binding protein [Calditrichota bacterium]
MHQKLPISLILLVSFLLSVIVLPIEAKPTIAVILPETERNFHIVSDMRLAIEQSYMRFNDSDAPEFDIEFHNNYADTDSTTAVTNRLCSRPEIVTILGGFPSSCAQITATLAHNASIPYLIISASDDTLTRTESNHVFRIAPPSTDYNDGLVSWAISIAGARRNIAIIYENHPRSEEVVADLMRDMRRRWRGAVARHSFEPGEEDFSGLIEALEDDKPTLVWIIGWLSDTARFMRQCRGGDWTPIAFVAGTAGIVSNKMVSISEGASDYLFAPMVWWPKVTYPFSYEFVKEFNFARDYDPEYHAAEAYATMQVLLEAVSKCDVIDRFELYHALDEIDIYTVVGRVRFEDYRGFTNQNRMTTIAMQLQGQQWKSVWPLKYAETNYIYPAPDWNERENTEYRQKGPNWLPLLFVIAFGLLLLFGKWKRDQMPKELDE